MSTDWQVAEGRGWIAIAGFGEINPRRDDVDGGRQYFTAKTDEGEVARATGGGVSGGSENWHFTFDQPFWLADSKDRCVQVEISALVGGRYAVKYREAQWPIPAPGAW